MDVLTELGEIGSKFEESDKIIETLTQRGRAWHKYREDIIQANQYFAFSMSFGWTPEQIDKIDNYTKLVYLHLLKGSNKISRKMKL